MSIEPVASSGAPVAPALAKPESKKKLNMINVAALVASLVATAIATILYIPVAMAGFGGFSVAASIYAAFYNTPKKNRATSLTKKKKNKLRQLPRLQ